MRNIKAATLTSFTSVFALATLAALGAGCGSAPISSSCVPDCLAGFSCVGSTCVADVGDMAVAMMMPVVDMAASCVPACSGAQPYCNAAHQCVSCLTDAQCPIGQVCMANGGSSSCVPGCDSDARCHADGGNASLACCGGGCTDVASDTSNCGACGTACGSQHSSATCTNGACVAGACEAGWGDCNHDPKDGCEANTRIDPNNCTMCGMACNFPNAIDACADGCYIAACQFGYDDCNGDPSDGCEVSVLSDVQNCGSCGNVCPNAAHSQVACVATNCEIKDCNPNYADCNRVFMDGCEIDLATDKNNCGTCGTACAQGQVCIAGMCTCPPCNFANAMSACVNNQCALGACNQFFGNCDGNAQNGCELPLQSDVNNCGACGNVCANGLVCTNGGCTCPQCNFANAKSKCVNNACALDACLQGYGNCDGNAQNGCETNFATDSQNCGGCGMACPMNAPTCIMGACSSTLHLTEQWANFQTANNSCNMNVNGVVIGNYQWLNLGAMTWKACMLEGSKRGAQIRAPSYGPWPLPGWFAHRNPNSTIAMIGQWANYITADISTMQNCILLVDPQSVALKTGNNAPLSDSVSFDGNQWHYQDFGIHWIDECELLAGKSGASIITPATVGLGSGDGYWLGVLHTCSVYAWSVNGTNFAYDNTIQRQSQKNCMVGYMDN